MSKRYPSPDRSEAQVIELTHPALGQEAGSVETLGGLVDGSH